MAPGGTVSVRFTQTAGTTPTQTVTFIFRGKSGRSIRILTSTGASLGSASAAVDASWLDDTYELSLITLIDEWSRLVACQRDGLVTTTNSGNYAGPTTHAVDFSSLDFTVSSPNKTEGLPKLTVITAQSSAPLTPGQSARFRYEGRLNGYTLTSLAFTFRATNGIGSYTANADPSALTGDLEIPIVAAMGNARYRLTSVSMSERSVPFITLTDTSASPTGPRVRVTAGGFVSDLAADEPFLGPVEFSVTGSSATFSPPRLSDWRRDTSADVSPGALVRFFFTTASTGFPVRDVVVRLGGPFGGTREFTVASPSGTFEIPTAPDWLSGPYSFVRVTVTDTAGNSVFYLPGGGTLPGVTVGALPVSAELFRFTVSGPTLLPYFTLQPSAETGVRAGAEATLFARAAGASPVAYQWFRGEPGDTSTPLSNSPTTTIGPAGDRLTVQVPSPATYWVRATSGGMSIDSTAARVVVALPPVITVQPVGRAGPVGGTVSFSVKASGFGPLTYRWTAPFPNATGADKDTIQVGPLRASDTGLVYCEVSNIAGTTSSVRVPLSVLTYPETLRITLEPFDQIITPQTPRVDFRAEIYGNPPLFSRWQKDGIDLPGSDSITPYNSYHPSTLTVGNTPSNAEGTYRLVVHNGFETAYSREVRLRVVTAPVIDTQPTAEVAVPIGNTLVLSVGATGLSPLAYQWRLNGVPLAGATDRQLFRNISSAADAGAYDVVVSNSAGTATSSSARVNVVPAPVRPTIVQGPTDRTARPGETLTFAVVTSPADNILYRWSKDDRDFPDGAGPTFTLRNVGSSDSGRYRVWTSTPGSSGSTIRDFVLSVAPAQNAPVITRQPVSTTVLRGGTAWLNAAADGRGPLRFQWRHRGIALPSPSSLETANEPILRVANFDSTKIGAYDVVVTNDSGTVTSSPSILSLPPPSDTGRLVNVSVRAPAGGVHGPLVVGFVLGGGKSEPVPLLIRATGNALTTFGVTGVLANPSATLYSGSAVRFINDDWSNHPPVAATSTRLGAFALSASASRDAAFAPVVPPGAYTVHVNGDDAAGGIVLAEIYEATPAEEITDERPRLLNLSVQTKATNGNPVIAGFAVSGARAKRILLRAVGPSLGQFGVTGRLADPVLSLFRGSTVIAGNNDWAGEPSLREAFNQAGAFQLEATASKDAAIITTLNPGAYTVQVSGVANGEGTVLVEVYELP